MYVFLFRLSSQRFDTRAVDKKKNLPLKLANKAIAFNGQLFNTFC